MDKEIMINALVNGEIELEAIEKELYICDFRKMIYRKLHTNVSKQHINIIRKLMVIEIAEREKDPYDDEIVIEETYDYEAFYWCVFLLSRIGDVHDVFTIWYAKHIDFDASFGVEWQFLIGAGYNETIEFLKKSDNPQSLEIISYLLNENTKSIEENELFKEWFDFRYKYFLDK